MGPLNQDWEVRSLDDLDSHGLQLVSDFFNEQFPGVFYPKCTPEIFKWKLGSSNPAGKGFITAAINEGKVIGVFSITKKNMVKEGIKISVGEIGDAYTHPQFRRGGKCISPNEHLGQNDVYYEKSIFGRLVVETLFRAKINGVKFVYGTPNTVAKPSYIKRLEFLECDGGRVFSKYLLTKYFQTPYILSLILNGLNTFNYFYSKLLVRVYFGRNSICEVSGAEVLNDSHINNELSPKRSNRLEMLINNQYILNRYINHPTLKYSFYRVSSKSNDLGYVIATEIVRASGIRTMVISDWITIKPEFTKRFHLVLGCLRGYSGEAQTISLWQSGRTPKLNLLFSGIFSAKQVSIVGKSLDDQISTRDFAFSDFHFGWSDNG